MTGLRWTEEELQAYERKHGRQPASVDTYAPRSAPTTKPPAPVRPMPPAQSKLERRFAQQLAEATLPAHQRNYFFIKDRDFELDFAWPGLKTAVEIQGMAHRIKANFKRDIEKRALALLAGWKLLELDGAAVRSGHGIEWLKKLLEKP